jgi:hypothetical protein
MSGSRSAINESIAPVANTNLKLIKGELTGVKIVAGQAGSFRSVAQLNYNIECTQRLESFTSAVETRGANFTIYAAAILSDSRDPNGISCRGFTNQTQEVTLAGGAISVDQVTLVDLNFMPSDATFNTETNRLVPNETLQIAKVEPLCPPNTNCVLNGTIVTIQAIRPCSQSQGPSAYAFKAEADDTLTLAVASYGILKNIAPDAALCRGLINETIRIDLVNQFVTADKIQLKKLQ